MQNEAGEGNRFPAANRASVDREIGRRGGLPFQAPYRLLPRQGPDSHWTNVATGGTAR